MMRGGRRILITVWSSSRTSGCSSQGLSEMHWEGRERERSGYIPSKTTKRSRPCSIPKCGAISNVPQAKTPSPTTCYAASPPASKGKVYFNTNTDRHKHRATQHSRTSRSVVSWSHFLFFYLPLSILLCFCLGIYQWSHSIEESKEQDLCQTSGMDWADSKPQGHTILWPLLPSVASATTHLSCPALQFQKKEHVYERPDSRTMAQLKQRGETTPSGILFSLRPKGHLADTL